MKGVGPWLKKLRHALNWSQSEMAEVLGLSARESVGAIEGGKTVHVEGSTLESLLDLCRWDEKQLGKAVKQGTLPDLPALRNRRARIESARHGNASSEPPRILPPLMLTDADSAIIRDLAQRFHVTPEYLLHLMVTNEKNQKRDFVIQGGSAEPAKALKESAV